MSIEFLVSVDVTRYTEKSGKYIRRALPDAMIRLKTHSNISWFESKVSHAAPCPEWSDHGGTSSSRSLSLSLSLSFSWKLRIPCGLSMHTRTTNDARIFIVVQKYTRREIYRKVLLIARWPHKSTLWPLPVIAGTTCVPRDFNDEAKRCDASLRVSDNVYILR